MGALLTFPTPVELPRWNEPHRCTDHAEHVHTWRQLTRYGSAVWLVQECQVCGEPWDVLSDRSDEAVIIASVFPVWAVKGCEMCTNECAGDACGCPCHREQITAEDLRSDTSEQWLMRPTGTQGSGEGFRLVAGGRCS